MTEPGTGLDLQSIKTTERMHNIGQLADLVKVIQTDSTQGAKALSLMVIGPENNNGFARGRTLDKIALKRQNTSEVFFDNRRIGPECLLDGQEGQGFWPQARSALAIGGAAVTETAVKEPIAVSGGELDATGANKERTPHEQDQQRGGTGPHPDGRRDLLRELDLAGQSERAGGRHGRGPARDLPSDL
tara:strand:- start:850 stop:1413 length:564 start_codon:yes stop_codon:yes gene_type:complete